MTAPSPAHRINTSREFQITVSTAFQPAGNCAHVHRIETIETPFITELVAALAHLKNAARLTGTSAALLLPGGSTVSEQQMSIWAAMNAHSIAALLDEITAAYPSLPANTAPESGH
ncbi:hypothetical protein AB0M94_35490 [Streptomyces xanthochromogenes]|uniref:hypothetical protein n=1 Tax=Streptomyces xanthochromogenes TaxID=67384 RepID=UPI00343AC32C